jgi:hypothetical protein
MAGLWGGDLRMEQGVKARDVRISGSEDLRISGSEDFGISGSQGWRVLQLLKSSNPEILRS